MSADEALQPVIQAVLTDLVVSETASHIILELPHERLCLRKVTLADDWPTWAAPAEPAFYDRLQTDSKDLLAELVLQAGEPSFESVAAALPPVRDVTLLGVETEIQRFEVTAEGQAAVLGDGPLPEGWRLLRVGLLDGYLPVLCHLYDTPEGTVERLTFASTSKDGPLLRRRVRIIGDELTAAARYECAAATSAEVPEFWDSLLELVQRWRTFFDAGVELELPEPDLLAAARGMLAQGVLSFRGLLPRYGMGWYDLEQHNSFPPAVLFLVQALLAWGLIDRTGDVLSHYLSRYVKPDGTIDYYGPAVAEYGQLLTLVAEYVALSGDSEWLARRVTLLRPLWERLVDLREESLAEYPQDDPRRGLIPGLPEADYHGQEEEWKRFYYSGDVWAARGLEEVGKALLRVPVQGLIEEGRELVAEAKRYRQAIVASVRQGIGETGYVPVGPDQLEPIEYLIADRPASYCNYRYFPEMVSAGILPPEQVQGILDWRHTHGGELLGTTRFDHRLDDWPALHHARGMLEQDEMDNYLLLMYSHWAHHCTQGTLAAYEMVTLRPDETGARRLAAGQVVPCEVMVPTMLRWGLVYEERDADVLWLCRAMPRRWLEPGQKVVAKAVPTRFGEVGFSLKTGGQGTKIALRLPGESAIAEVRLRLRGPRDRQLRQVLCDGQPVPFEGDTVRLVNPRGKLKLQVEWE
ncbi:MAG: hypothetical protein ABFD94_08180 [Armatimonadia bacterium]